jgi:hypothetical protein
MTDLESKLRILASYARSETHPHVDVTDKVIAILTDEQYQHQRILDRPLLWLAALSSAAAAFTVLFAFVLYEIGTDPLLEISQAISWVMQ